jgi:lipopolysaccharide export system protein LptA
MIKNARIILFLLLAFLPSIIFSQGKKIDVKANSLEFDEKLGEGAKRLVGDVIFTHQGATMFCDSAYLYKNNTLDGFGHIHIRQGDSLHLYGKKLHYDGNTKKAEVYQEIRLTDKDLVLTTDFLFYDLNSSIATYNSGGVITSKENLLTSESGYYYSKTRQFAFKNNVVLTNPQYVINSDTLLYNTYSKVAYFLGPTTIKSQANLIYAENGWYDTKNDISRFSKKAYIVTKEQKLYGDSLYYDRKIGYGKAMNNVHIIDSLQNIKISGNIAEHYEGSDNSLVHGKALLIQVYNNDTLFLHADTLRATYTDKNGKIKLPLINNPYGKNPNNKDSLYRILFAYHRVKFYKSDIQGKCDSLAFSYIDSTMRLFGMPVLWSDKNQLTAEKVSIKTGKGEIRSLNLDNTAFIISQEDSLRFNQIKGKNMEGSFKESKLYKIKVEGNGQTVYYAKDKEKIIGVNRADCTDLLIFLKENKVDKITFINQPEATLYPINELSPKELLLKDFIWKGSERPMSKKDVFVW